MDAACFFMLSACLRMCVAVESITDLESLGCQLDRLQGAYTLTNNTHFSEFSSNVGAFFTQTST